MLQPVHSVPVCTKTTCWLSMSAWVKCLTGAFGADTRATCPFLGELTVKVRLLGPVSLSTAAVNQREIWIEFISWPRKLPDTFQQSTVNLTDHEINKVHRTGLLPGSCKFFIWKSPPLMKPDILLPCSQEPATNQYWAKLMQSKPPPYFFKTHFNIIILPMLRFNKYFHYLVYSDRKLEYLYSMLLSTTPKSIWFKYPNLLIYAGGYKTWSSSFSSPFCHFFLLQAK